MEFLFASRTGHFGHLISGSMQDEKTNIAFFNSFESFINISLPKCQCVHKRSILMLKKIRSIEMYYSTKSDVTSIMGISVSRRRRVTLYITIKKLPMPSYLLPFSISLYFLQFCKMFLKQCATMCGHTKKIQETKQKKVFICTQTSYFLILPLSDQ